MQIGNLGQIALKLEPGSWDETVSYPALTALRHGPALWGALRQTVAGEEPGISPAWMMMARDGVDGEGGGNDPRITENPEGLPLWQGDDWPGGGADLSFEEQWTGRYDAREDPPRKIYTKTIDMAGYVPGVETVSVPHGIVGLSYCLRCEGMLANTARTGFIALPRSSANVLVYIQISATNISIFSNYNLKTSYPIGFLTIEYTKEDD